jgi:hypothetical protein
MTWAVLGEAEHALAIAKRMRTGQVDINGAQLNPLAPVTAVGVLIVLPRGRRGGARGVGR